MSGGTCMRDMDKDGLILCELQAKAFELSATYMTCSSRIFIRRYMNSNVVKTLDNGEILQSNLDEKDILAQINEEYGVSEYGKIKYQKNELYWIGYIYRYYTYVHDISSKKAYKEVKPDELKNLFLPYHTLSPMQAIERIIESKDANIDETELERQYRVFKKNRLRHGIE